MRRYSDEFKLAAVRLSQEPGIQVQTVAVALAIHPFMLSKWRKDARDGRLRGAAPTTPPTPPTPPMATVRRDLARLQQLEREYTLLQEEHDLLKKPSGSVPLDARHLRLQQGPRQAGAGGRRPGVSARRHAGREGRRRLVVVDGSNVPRSASDARIKAIALKIAKAIP